MKKDHNNNSYNTSENVKTVLTIVVVEVWLLDLDVARLEVRCSFERAIEGMQDAQIKNIQHSIIKN